MTTAEMIRTIELKTGHTVYVGKIPGTDTNHIWACVDCDERQATIQCPAITADEAVAELYSTITGETK